MSVHERYDGIIVKYNQIGEKIADPGALDSKEFAKLSKEYSDMGEVVAKIEELKACVKEREELEEMLSGDDEELREMAELESAELDEKIPEIELEVKVLLLPKDEADEKNAILEVRAGTGGDEAALFAMQLFRMYQRYSDLNGWKFEIMSVSETGIGGYKEASANITGRGVFARLKYESGVHRVQRVPETESGGRIHTSAATVAVLPEAEEVDVHIEEKDLRVDVFRASGAGGQHVNTTESAVRITHIPTGVVVSQQDEKSQHKNRAKAMKILRSRVYEAEREKLAAERAADRKGQVGSGDRSERIRTYNYPQGRVSDHRINLTLYKIEEIVTHGQLDELVNALSSEDQAQKLAAAV